MNVLRNIEPGDIVRVKMIEDIRYWEEIHGEQVPFHFPDDMSYLCGNEYVVEYISGEAIKLKGQHWNISLPMLECIVDEECVININEELLMKFLEV